MDVAINEIFIRKKNCHNRICCNYSSDGLATISLHVAFFDETSYPLNGSIILCKCCYVNVHDIFAYMHCAYYVYSSSLDLCLLLS